MSSDAAQLVAYIRENLPALADARLENEYEYSCVPLCVIDAVFSMGVRYESTHRTVVRFCEAHGWERSRREAAVEHPVSELVEILRPSEGHFEEANVFGNRQRTSTRSRITKAEAVYRFAKILQIYNIDTFSDAQERTKNPRLEEVIRQIPGQKSGISFAYFLILVGRRDVVKPDRMIRRFVATGIGRTSVTQAHANELVMRASAALIRQFPNLKPAVLDNAIWKFQRTAHSPEVGQTFIRHTLARSRV